MQDTITLQDGTSVQVADFDFGFTLDAKAQITTNEDDGKLIIEGYASDFGIDREDEAFEPGAFEEGIKAYMQNPVVLYHHKKDTAMGQILDHRIDKGGLWVKAAIDKPADGTQLANYYQQVKNRVLRGFSVGGKFFRRMTPQGPRIFKCDVQEISITPQPINPRMLFAVAGKAFEGMDDETETHDIKALEDALARIDGFLSVAEGGKAGQHADGPHISALMYHVQKIHTLALDAKQDSQTSNEMTNRAAEIAKDAEKHSKGLHHLAAKHGPLHGAYGDSMF
jgi:HK97 family phage prohead protease